MWGVMCSPLGRMKRSYLGGFRVKLGPTKVTLVTMRFHCFFRRFPLCSTLNISVSATGRTWRSGARINQADAQKLRTPGDDTAGRGSSALVHALQNSRTLGRGTSHFPAFCFRFCLMVLLSTFALSTCSRHHHTSQTHILSVYRCRD